MIKRLFQNRLRRPEAERGAASQGGEAQAIQTESIVEPSRRRIAASQPAEARMGFETASKSVFPVVLTLLLSLGSAWSNTVRAASAHLETALFSPRERAGDLDGLALEWLKVLADPPKSPEIPLPELLLRRLREILPKVADPYRLVEPLRKLVDTRGLQGVERRLARDLLGGLYRRQGREEARRALELERGYITHWVGIGPFGLGSATQLDHLFQVEESINFERPHEQRSRMLHWRPVTALPPSRSVHPRLFLRSSGGIYYHLAQLHSATSQVVAIELTSSRPMRLFVNGELVLAEDEDRFITNPRRVVLPLAAGWNHLLLKNRGGPFAALVTDLAGEPMAADLIAQEKDFTLHPSAENAPETTAQTPELPLRWLGNKTGQADELAAHRLALALLSGFYDRPELAVDHAEHALQIAPENPFVHYHAGRVFRHASHLPRSYSTRRARTAFETALKLDDSFVPARLSVAEFLFSDQQPRRAAEAARKALEENADSLATLRFLHKLYVDEEWEREAHEMAERIQNLSPASPIPHLYLARVAEAGSNPTQAVEHYWRAFEEDHRDTDLLQRIAEIESARGRVQEARKALEDFKRRLPGAPEPILALSRLEADLGQTDEAIRSLEELTSAYPENTKVLRHLAELQEETGKQEDALKTYRRILASEPGDIDIGRYVRHLEGRSRDRFWIPHDETLQEWIGKIPPDDAYPKADSLAVLDISVVKLYPDGSTEEYTHQAFKLLSEASKETLAEVNTRGEILKLQTLTAAGETLEPVAAQGRDSFVMPGLSKGGFVEYAYLSSRSRFDGWAFRNGPFFFQDFSPRQPQPFLLSRYVVIIPPGRELELLERAFHSDQKDMFAQVKRSEKKRGDGSRVITYETFDAPRLQPELRMPHRDEYIPNVLVTESRSWNEVAERLARSMRGRARLTPQLRRFAEEITQGIESPMEQARTLYREVNELVKTDKGPADANGILVERAGDRDILYKALVDACRIPALWAFARQREEIAVGSGLDHPYPDLFQAVFLYVHPPDAQPSWVTLGEREVPFGRIPYTFQGGTALLLKSGGPTLVPIPSFALETSADSTTGSLALSAVEGDPFAALVDLEMVSQSFVSFSSKTQIKSLDAHRRDLSLRRVANSLFPGAEVKSASFLGLETLGERLTIKMDLEAPKFLFPSEGEVLMRSLVQPLRLVRSLIRSPERKHPYKFTSQVVKRDRLEVRLGKLYNLSRLPSGTLLTSPIGSYSLRFYLQDGHLQIEREVNLQPATVAPERFGELIGFCQAVDQAESERVVLKPTSGD